MCVQNSDLRGLWVARSPTHEAWARVAVLPEVRYHVDIVRKVTGTRARALDRTGGLVQFVGNRFRAIAPLKRKGRGYGVPDRVGEWFEWRQVAQTWENTNEK